MVGERHQVKQGIESIVSFFDMAANNDEKEKGNWSKLPVEHPRKLIPELCRLFYQLGWVTGST
jgi:hypothetical protein